MTYRMLHFPQWAGHDLTQVPVSRHALIPFEGRNVADASNYKEQPVPVIPASRVCKEHSAGWEAFAPVLPLFFLQEPVHQ